MEQKLAFQRIDTASILEEIADRGLPRNAGTLKIPLNFIRTKLWQLAELAIEIDDPRLSLWCCQMTLFSCADPKSDDYDPKIFEKLKEEIFEKYDQK
ncbi:hypothetical protein [Methanococcus maripaludis]|jgi:hypothetical protein|uniref:Uncharacterized protein n=1 Tax=Methanococcus maripaludis TaxID=39152 RepID=A0A7J9P0C6_METMI|nr:hypothetical protein [Methanococcus maripaludis]MBA2852997.1 hypothetical protein [Methanococcus maripaludis]MBA2860952.1 hypothetical protein [Methanococcus maripaludis]